MQQVLRDNLLSCATAFAKERKVALSTLGKMAAGGDAPFFQRLSDPSKTFTAQKYDDVMLWFSANWPAGLPWPADVFRPNAPNTPPPDSTAAHGGAASPDPIPGTAAALAPDGDAGRAGVPAAADN